MPALLNLSQVAYLEATGLVRLSTATQPGAHNQPPTRRRQGAPQL